MIDFNLMNYYGNIINRNEQLCVHIVNGFLAHGVTRELNVVTNNAYGFREPIGI